ncbi:hypothetical protein MUK42_37382 [Musa troglodytarum]|uniref:Uncharacterized protein n=1 Tax=Musa troglodytarum TaxID=320322 RepID=A0A9E7GXS1_9LILI|nr:hypothetical protein MUK42_37382 [Musa troglodytarum]
METMAHGFQEAMPNFNCSSMSDLSLVGQCLGARLANSHGDEQAIQDKSHQKLPVADVVAAMAASDVVTGYSALTRETRKSLDTSWMAEELTHREDPATAIRILGELNHFLALRPQVRFPAASSRLLDCG